MDTPKLPVVAPAVTDTPVGERLAVQGTPACVTVKDWPAIVTTPVRGVMLVLAAMLYATVPLPLPPVAPVSVIQPTVLDAVHAQPAFVVTETDPVRAPAVMERLVGEMENVQPAAWVIVKVCPAIVSEPVRGLVVVFAATEKLTVPGPEPLLPPVIVAHAALLLADQLHPAATDTPTDPVVDAAPTDVPVGVIAEAHKSLNAN
jgi:hypothetical protein